MKEKFIRLSNLHRYNTRGSCFSFQVPKQTNKQTNKQNSSGSFYYNAIANLNRLPDDIKSTTLKPGCFLSAKTHLFKSYMYFLVLMFGVFIHKSFNFLNVFKGSLWK